MTYTGSFGIQDHTRAKASVIKANFDAIGADLVALRASSGSGGGSNPTPTPTPADTINLLNYREASDTTDQQALDRIKTNMAGKRTRIRLPEASGLGANGRFLLGYLTQNEASAVLQTGNWFPGLVEFYGDGVGRTIIQRAPGCTYDLGHNPAGINRIELADNLLRGLHAHDFTVWREELPFDEHAHQIMLNGVTDVLLEDVELLGSNADGLHMGQGDRDGQVRFSERITTRRLLILGRAIAGKIGGNNRNGISLLAGRNIDLEAVIGNFTRRGGAGAYDANDSYTGFAQPAMFDIEPNFGGDKLLIQDVRARLYVFNGGGGGVAVFLPPHHDAPNRVRGVRIEIIGEKLYRGAANIVTYGAGTVGYDVEIDASVDLCERPFEARRGTGMKMRVNATRFNAPALSGYPGGDRMTDFDLTLNADGGAIGGGGALLQRGGTGHIGGLIRGGDVGITFASTNLLEKMKIDAEFDGQSVFPMQAVDFGEGEPNVDWGSVDMTQAEVHGKVSSAYIAGASLRDVAGKGAIVRSLPQRPVLPMGHTLRLLPAELGGPLEVMTVKANAAGSPPAFAVQKRFLPVPNDPTTQFTQDVILVGGVIDRGNKRFESIDRGLVYENTQQFLAGTDQTIIFVFSAPAKSATNVVFWLYNINGAPGINDIGAFGIAFDALAINNGVQGQAVAYVGGNPQGYLGAFELGRQYSIQISRGSNGLGTVIWRRKNDAGTFDDMLVVNGVNLVGNYPLRRGMQIGSGQTAQFIQG